ncbi:cupin domain-containing protein [Falsirhodobacter sp. 1013]|uniref:cupin domain-containing protein n=1 Tax=Falsirhodobacter sp. 1013 TaxID=3417566 RepID=UPI003EC082E0
MTSLPPIHRVVTGHRADGTAIIVEDEALAHVHPLKNLPGTVFHEVWSTPAAPVIAITEGDPVAGPVSLSPPPGGTRIRFVDIPPDTEDYLKTGAAKMSGAFTEIGERHASTVREDAPHPLMHRTESVDYGIVIDGEMTLVVDDGETVLRPGTVVIQRGTNHAWANRSGKTCRMLFVLVSAEYEPDLGQAIQDRG